MKRGGQICEQISLACWVRRNRRGRSAPIGFICLRVVFQDQYTSQPANGKKCNDLRLLADTAYKF
jgi:hypothetical protein